jgi:hypothetical protein
MKVDTALLSAKTMNRLTRKSMRDIKANHHAFLILR